MYFDRRRRVGRARHRNQPLPLSGGALLQRLYGKARRTADDDDVGHREPLDLAAPEPEAQRNEDGPRPDVAATAQIEDIEHSADIGGIERFGRAQWHRATSIKG